MSTLLHKIYFSNNSSFTTFLSLLIIKGGCSFSPLNMKENKDCLALIPYNKPFLNLILYINYNDYTSFNYKINRRSKKKIKKLNMITLILRVIFTLFNFFIFFYRRSLPNPDLNNL